jgi:hypothetical protein
MEDPKEPLPQGWDERDHLLGGGEAVSTPAGVSALKGPQLQSSLGPVEISSPGSWGSQPKGGCHSGAGTHARAGE